MRILIVSHTPHYLLGGELVGWGPTLREIDHLAVRFDEVVHIAPLHPESAPASSIPYRQKNIRFVPVSPSGGDTIGSKLSIIRQIPEYLAAFRREQQQIDIVHIRCPSNISLVCLLALCAQPERPLYRWVKYAGNWQPQQREAFSYTLQRWILKYNVHRGIVTVNGEWPDQPAHVHSFYNPCLTREEETAAIAFSQSKCLIPPVRLLFVGRLESSKGVREVLAIANGLKRSAIPFFLDLIGDGPEKSDFIQLARSYGIESQVSFRGWLPRQALADYYRQAHFFVLPSSASEGWPKVLSEAMAYGAVPLASDVSSIPQILTATGSGFAIPAQDVDQYIHTIQNLVGNPQKWKDLSRAGEKSATAFSYETYLTRLSQMFSKTWGIHL